MCVCVHAVLTAQYLRNSLRCISTITYLLAAASSTSVCLHQHQLLTVLHVRCSDQPKPRTDKCSGQWAKHCNTMAGGRPRLGTHTSSQHRRTLNDKLLSSQGRSKGQSVLAAGIRCVRSETQIGLLSSINTV